LTFDIQYRTPNSLTFDIIVNIEKSQTDASIRKCPIAGVKLLRITEPSAQPDFLFIIIFKHEHTAGGKIQSRPLALQACACMI
jgi:hypothetical protein